MERHGNVMPEPERGGEGWLEAFCALLRVRERQRPLFCAHLCHMFCVHHQTPAMLFSGPPGSGKTDSRPPRAGAGGSGRVGACRRGAAKAGRESAQDPGRIAGHII